MTRTQGKNLEDGAAHSPAASWQPSDPPAPRYNASMRRRLLTTISVLSLVLCLAVSALWVRSYFRSETIARQGEMSSEDGQAALWMTSSRGGLRIGWQRRIPDAKASPPGFAYKAGFPARQDYDHGRGGFGYNDRPFAFGNWRNVGAPHWAVASVLLAAGTPCLYRRKPSDPRLCRRCGYNLTGNTSGVCPECGTPTTVGVNA
jgi:ribosomal protein L37E